MVDNCQPMPTTLSSGRLTLTPLALADYEFIFELVNTAEWKRFIGERFVTNLEKAEAYVNTVIKNPNVNYWVVRLKDKNLSIGIVSLVKRDYLDFFDVGFAFLPAYTGQGYAYEASMTFIENLVKEDPYQTILATTLQDNTNSISLLKKLGFQFEKQIHVDKEDLQLFRISTDKFAIDRLTRSFFSLFTNADERKASLDVIYELCLPEAIIIKKSGVQEEVYDLTGFIEPRKKILTGGTLTSFEEKETSEETKIAGGVAQRFSKYRKSGFLKGSYFNQTGNKFFQFVKTTGGWKINSVVWEDDL